MKKSIFFAALMMGAFVFTACDKGGTPQTDSTKLWPAQPSEDSNWGFVNGKDAKLVISAKYQDVNMFSCGYARVQDENSEYAFIDKNGAKVSAKMQIDENTTPDDFYYDVCRVTIDNHFAFLDKDFKKLTRADYVWLSPMSEDGLASFRLEGDDLEGYCDKDGNQKIQPKYNDAGSFIDGIAVVMERHEDGTEWYYTIDTKGTQLCEETKKPLINLGEQRVYYTTDQGKVVLLDKNGTEIDLAASYSDIDPFTDGLAKVTNKNGDKIGYIDPKGAEKIEVMYAAGYQFYEGLAWVKTAGNNGKWMVINNKGGEEGLKLSSSQDVGYAGLPNFFHNGLAYYNNGNKVFLADKSGDIKYDWKLGNGGNGGGWPAPAVKNPMAGTKYGPIFEDYLKHKAALH